ncbi:hypothetical protein [Streptomyces sp. NPDC093111]|uniref:hypothetical protein n=1 Tax=Streptomyces sp. NPDC093111 TaxID=3154978 RepID=UPI003442BDD3
MAHPATHLPPRAVCVGEDCRRSAVDGGGKRRVRPDLRLCPPCLGRLVAALEELPGLYAACERVLGGAGPARGSGERRGTGGRPAGIPLNGPAAEVRSAIVATLGSWSGLVADERGFPAPRRTPVHLAAFLLRSAEWLAAHPAVADATRELDRLVGAARRVAREPVRHLPVGPCVEPGCTGGLAVVGGTRRILCDADPAHQWASHEWTRLRRAMPGQRVPAQGAARVPAQGTALGQAQSAPQVPAQAAPPAPEPVERWLTARDIADLWGAPTGTVYRLASEQRWRRRNRCGRTYYAESDVHGSFSGRRPRTPAMK